MEELELKGVIHLPRTKTIDIEFQNISYTVKKGRKDKKHVIKNVSGKFKSGELTAIMGPSGAGKTSLLNILTGFQTSGAGGSIKCTNLDSTKKGALKYKKESCYILQDDHLAPFFTVSEIMNMAADLKLGSEVSEKKKEFLVDEILSNLGLVLAKDTRCARLSGGQKKRLSVALELIDNPPIMFLDEPTTGLDSMSSTQCIQMLKALARGGRTIVCTIHQPSASLYELFDHVYVMAEGKCIYQGASINTVTYLGSFGLNCPQYHNPADYLLEVANGEYGNFTDILAAKAVDAAEWRAPMSKPKHVLQVKSLTRDSIYCDNLSVTSKSPPSEWKRFFILLQRSMLQIYRDWTISHLKFSLHLLVGIFLGITYLNFGQDASKTVNNIGFFMVSIVYLIYTSLMPGILKFPSELAVLKKEQFNNWYNLKTYYAAYLVVDIPLQIMFSAVYTAASYLLSAQPLEVRRYLMVQLILSLVTSIASGMGTLLGTTVNPINGTFLGAILTALMLVVAGFLIFFTHMPGPMYYLSYISYIAFAFEGMVEAIYGFNRAPLTCPEDVEYCHFKFPNTLRHEIGLDKDNFWVDVAYLTSNLILFRVASFYTLRRKVSGK